MSPEWIAFVVVGAFPLVMATLGFQVLRQPRFRRSMWAVLGTAALAGVLGLAGIVPIDVSVGTSVLVMIPFGQAALWTAASTVCNHLVANGTSVGIRAQAFESVAFIVTLLFAFVVCDQVGVELPHWKKWWQ